MSQCKNPVIDNFFSKRKRPATDELTGHPSKQIARKLFDVDRPHTPTHHNDSEEPSQKPERPTTPTQSPSTHESLRKELNLGEFKKITRRNRKYTTSLKEKAEKFLKKYKPGSEPGAVELKKFDSIDVEVPASPVKCGTLTPKRLFWKSPVRSPAKDLSSRRILFSSPTKSTAKEAYVSPRKLLDELPKQTTPVKRAYKEFHHLLASGQDALVLPNKYMTLKEIFRSLEMTVRFSLSRQDTVPFHTVQKSVQQMIHRNFTEEHLGKIKAVYPESYDFLRANVKISPTETKNELFIKRLSHKVQKDGESEVELSNTQRLEVFHDRLLQKTKSHHAEFLSKLTPPIILDSSKLTVWHPDFNLHSVPDIVPEPLPQPPVTKIFTAKEVLDQARQLYPFNPRMVQAVSKLADKQKKPETETDTPKTTPSASTIIPKQLTTSKKPSKRYLEVLEKVRAKEAAKMIETMTQTPAQAKETVMLSRLPELARVMRNIYFSEKKNVLPLDEAMQRIAKSYSVKMERSQLMEHLKLMETHVPGWMNFCVSRNVHYLRVSKDSDMSRILGKLQNLANPL